MIFSSFRKKTEQFQKGFTLIELMIVMVIISILVAVIFIATRGDQEMARDSRRQSDISQIKKSLQAYYLANNSYPTANTSISLEDDTANVTFVQAMKEGGYMSLIPRDPRYTSPTGEYTYKYISTTSSAYTLCAKSEAKGDYICSSETGVARVASVPVFGWMGIGSGSANTWAKAFKSNGTYDSFYSASIQQTSDGGYIAGGYTYFTDRKTDGLVAKIDSDGNWVWAKDFGGPNFEDEIINSIQPTSDGGYIATGFTDSYEKGVFVMKLDSGGNQSWAKIFKFGVYEEAYSIQQTSDGGYIVTGRTTISYAGTKHDIFVMKLDSGGNKIWANLFRGAEIDEANSIQQTSDGGYIIAGDTSGDAIAMKITSDGNQSWAKSFSGSIPDSYFNSIQQASDGGYIAAGMIASGGYDCLIVKFDSDGNKIWGKTFGGGESDNIRSIQKTSDNGYIMVGSYSDSGNQDILMVKIDSDGNQSWAKTLGGIADEEAYSVRQTSDGGYVVGAETSSFGIDDGALAIKLDADGDILDCPSCQSIDLPFSTIANSFSDIALAPQSASSSSYTAAFSEISLTSVETTVCPE